MLKLRSFCVVLALFFGVSEAWAENRVALVIGNGNYPQVGVLTNPPNDARLMVTSLKKLGFDVIERIDVDQKGMKKAIRDFGKKLTEAGEDSVGLFYYAGHGVQANGTNYLIPVNVSIDSEADVDIEAITADAVQRQMAQAGNRMNIIILDACRNNPFKRSFRSASRGLAKMDATKGTLIAYATSPGDVAADGTGTNSPYTRALASSLLVPGLTVERMFKQVRNSVVTLTKSKQVPWEASSLVGADFYFTPPEDGGNSAPMTQESMFWQSIVNSDSPDDFKIYLEKYQNGLFKELAQLKVKTLKNRPSGSKLASLDPRGGQIAFKPGKYSLDVFEKNNECNKVNFDKIEATTDTFEGRWSHPESFGSLEGKIEDGIVMVRLKGRHVNSQRESVQFDGRDLVVRLDLKYSSGQCRMAFRMPGVLQ